VTRSKNSGAKMIAAAVGGGALVAMGVFTAVMDGGPTSDGPPVASMGPMSAGETVTQAALTTSTPPAALPTAKAVPSVKAKAYQ
jgi:hypothetical protein